MLGTRLVIPRRGRDEGEKPFWISYADLMTALMMLFLVVMAVALFAITSRNDHHGEEIDKCLTELESQVEPYKKSGIALKDKRIDFGVRALFDNDQYALKQETAQNLRAFTPTILEFAKKGCGKKLLKRVVVEGYTSQSGDYLHNLSLSLNRAHSVLCALYDAPGIDEKRLLTTDEKQDIRKLFVVGGYASNQAREKSDGHEDRRVELRLEFWGLDEPRTPDVNYAPEIGQCKLQHRVLAN